MAKIPVTRTLVRNERGTMSVVFVNTRTGEPVKDPFNSEKYEIIEQGNNLDFLDIEDTAREDVDVPRAGQRSANQRRRDGDSQSGRGVDRNIGAAKNYGWVDKPGWMDFVSMTPGLIGMGAKAVNAGINANNNHAINTARSMLGLDPATGVMGSLRDNRGGFIGRTEIGDNQYSVGFTALDHKGRTNLTPTEARMRSMVTGNPINEVAETAPVGGVRGLAQRARGALGTAINSVRGVSTTPAANPSTAAPTAPSRASSLAPSRAAQAGANMGALASPDFEALGVATRGYQSPFGAQPSEAIGANQDFGQRANFGGTVNHRGIDMNMNAPGMGTTDENAAIMSVAPGTVTFAGSKRGYGLTVEVTHPDNYTSQYSHLSSIGVEEGQQIGQGVAVGQLGNTGNSFGAHLHFSMKDPLGRHIDPMSMLDPFANNVPSPTARPGQPNSVNPLGTQDFAQTKASIEAAMALNEDLQSMSPVTAPRENFFDLAPSFTPANTPAPAPATRASAFIDPANVSFYSPGMRQVGIQNTMAVSQTPADVTPNAYQAPSAQMTESVARGLGNLTPSQVAEALSGVSAGYAASMGYAPQRSADDLSAMGFAIAGELSPSTLGALADPTNPGHAMARAEVANYAATMENRRSAAQYANNLTGVLSPSQYNSLMDENMGVTTENYAQFGTAIQGALNDFYSGTNPAPAPDATHMYSEFMSAPPSWAEFSIGQPTQVGNHIFSTVAMPGTLTPEYATPANYNQFAIDSFLADFQNAQAQIAEIDRLGQLDPNRFGFTAEEQRAQEAINAQQMAEAAAAQAVNDQRAQSFGPMQNSGVTKGGRSGIASVDFDPTSNQGYTGFDTTRGMSFAGADTNYGQSAGTRTSAERASNANTSMANISDPASGGWSGIDTTAGMGFANGIGIGSSTSGGKAKGSEGYGGIGSSSKGSSKGGSMGGGETGTGKGKGGYYGGGSSNSKGDSKGGSTGGGIGGSGSKGDSKGGGSGPAGGTSGNSGSKGGSKGGSTSSGGGKSKGGSGSYGSGQANGGQSSAGSGGAGGTNHGGLGGWGGY